MTLGRLISVQDEYLIAMAYYGNVIFVIKNRGQRPTTIQYGKKTAITDVKFTSILPILA